VRAVAAAVIMNGSIPQLVSPTTELDSVLASVEEASVRFSDPDPTIRSQGEAVFLHVRQSPAAIDFACFALCMY
jgi:predicted phage tail protein